MNKQYMKGATLFFIIVGISLIALGFCLGYLVCNSLNKSATVAVNEAVSSAISSVMQDPRSEIASSADSSENTSSSVSSDTIIQGDDVKMSEKPLVKADDDFKVVGYFPSWSSSNRDRLRYDVLTHVVYAFAIPTSDGDIRPLENPENAQAIIHDAHQNGVKVLLAVGGWSYNDNPLEPVFNEGTATPAKIDKMVSALLSLVDKYGFDGIDVDWEHPRVDSPTQAQYVDLLKALRKGLDERNLLLTAAVLSGVSADGNVMYDAAAHTDEALSLVDWINVMAYDGGDGDRHSSYKFAVDCGNYWTNTRKLPKEKVVLGVPFYARPSWSPYNDILQANPDAHGTDISMINGMQAHYNGIQTITDKTKWAIANGGGIMIWEISQDCLDDQKSLLVAIGKAIGE